MPKKFIKLNKLIRDKILDRMIQEGSNPRYIKLTGYPLVRSLFNKMREEVLELENAVDKENALEEFADVYTVLLALANLYNISIDDIEKMAREKCEKNGDFSHGIFIKSYIRDSDTEITKASVVSNDFIDERDLKEYKSERLL